MSELTINRARELVTRSTGGARLSFWQRFLEVLRRSLATWAC